MLFCNLIACIKGGFDYVGFEIDEDYYKTSNERIAKELEQITL